VHLVGYIIRIYHDARSPERQISKYIIYRCKYKTTYKWIVCDCEYCDEGSLSFRFVMLRAECQEADKHSSSLNIPPSWLFRNWFGQISQSVDSASWYICLIKTKKLHFYFLIYSNNLSSTCFEQSNIHHDDVVTVCAAYGIYRAEIIKIM